MCSINNTIIFLSVDANRVLQPHEDALVLTLGVGGLDLRRILVDLDSSVDLLQMLAYKQMNYSPSPQEYPGCLLSGFNGATTTSLGDVVLPVQTGPVTLNVRFSMVNVHPHHSLLYRNLWDRSHVSL